MAFELLAICVLLCLAALFSAAEISYTGLSLSQIKRINRVRPGAVELWEKHPDQILATLLLSNNAVNIAMGVLSAMMAEEVARTLQVRQGIMTLLFGFVLGIAVLIFGEIIPKVWARHQTVSWALRISPFMNRWTQMVSPLARLATRLTNFLLIGFRKKPTTPFLREEELKDVLANTSLPSHSKKILDNLLDFSATKVRDIMIPRNEMVTIASDFALDKIIRSVLASGYSRIPVYEGNLNRLKGLLFAKDLLVASRSGSLIVLDDLLRPAHFVEPDLPLSELFRVFKAGHHHMALVRRGEWGPIEGLVTLEDALETITGEIQEEI